MGIYFKSRVDLGTSTGDVLSGVRISLHAVPNIISKSWDILLSAGFVSASDTTFQ